MATATTCSDDGDASGTSDAVAPPTLSPEPAVEPNSQVMDESGLESPSNKKVEDQQDRGIEPHANTEDIPPLQPQHGGLNHHTTSDECIEEADKNPDDDDSIKPSPSFEHNFEAGDHVIRWEMLPIVYPIQIHGIVLESGPDSVTIADFGLTSYEEDGTSTGSKTEKEETDKEQGDAEKEEAEQGDASNEGDDKGDEVLTNDNVTQKIVMSAWEKMRPKENKSRLNVITIRDQKDIKAWKKVNYGANIFSKAKKGSSSWWKIASFNDSKDPADVEAVSKEVGSTSTNNVGTDGVDNADESNGPTDVQQIPETVSEEEIDGASECKDVPPPTSLPSSEPCPSDSLPSVGQTDIAANAKEEGQSLTPQNNSTVNGAPKTLQELIAEANMVERKSPPVRVVYSPKNDQSPSSQRPSKQNSWWPSSRKASSSHLTAADGGPRKDGRVDQGNPTARTGWWSSSSRNGYQRMPVSSDEDNPEFGETQPKQWNERHMNPAMSSLLASKSDTGGSTNRQRPSKQSRQKLPKSDPPKVVLARTRFLLEHGESVLPPYHVFYSNSECIAVWCMTGRWSTLQAAVFLHSTAVGNAKSATAITLGVAATQPWLIPALAVVGTAAVGMPWLILKRSKDRWEEATQKLTDLFWAQAEPEVFVECIQKWSTLGATVTEKPT